MRRSGSRRDYSGTEEGVGIGSYHASLGADEYRALLRASGFDVVRHVERDPQCNQHSVWLARCTD